MTDQRPTNHWIPQLIAVGGLGLVALVFAAEAFGNSPGIGRAQAAVGVMGVVVVLAAIALAVLERRGAIALPDWPLPTEPPAGWFAVALALWFGVLTGILDPILLRLQHLGGMRFIYINPHMSWMSPVSYAAFFLMAVGGVQLLGWGPWRWLRSDRFTAAWLVFLSVGSILILFQPEIHPAAALLVAAGAGVQGFRAFAGKEAGLRRMVRRSTGPLAGVVGLIVLLQLGLPVLRERQALAALPEAPDAPNVVVVILDTVRGASLSFQGYERETTPNLARRAAGGAIFERGISTSSWSAPSHATLVTGRYPFELTVDWRAPLSDRYPTLGETMSASGFRTGGFSANKLYTGAHTGLGRGMSRWDIDVVSLPAVIGASEIGRSIIVPRRFRAASGNANPIERKTAPMVTDEFIDWVASDPSRPFYALLNYFDAHGPYDEAPPPYDTMFNETNRPERPLNPSMNPDDILRDNDLYDGEIAYLDSEIERMLVRLEEVGQLDRTVIIFTSDHGEEFGEKDALAHGNSLNYAVLHVPLVVIGPGVPAGARFTEPASIRDIPATVIDLSGASSGPELPGSSLARFWDETVVTDDPQADLVFAAAAGRSWLPDAGERRFGNMLALFSGPFRYGRYGTESDEELFDLVNDPWEGQDLSDLPEYAETVARFRAATDAIASEYMQR